DRRLPPPPLAWRTAAFGYRSALPRPRPVQAPGQRHRRLARSARRGRSDDPRIARTHRHHALRPRTQPRRAHPQRAVRGLNAAPADRALPFKGRVGRGWCRLAGFCRLKRGCTDKTHPHPGPSGPAQCAGRSVGLSGSAAQAGRPHPLEGQGEASVSPPATPPGHNPPMPGKEPVAVLTIAISSRALFDLEDSHDLFEREGIEPYAQYQRSREDEILEPGMAFPLVRKLLALNVDAPPESPRVEVILLSRNSADTGLRIFNSIQHHKLD